MRVFASRFTPDLKPGDGHLIGWEIGEICSVWKGKCAGLLFGVDSEGMEPNPKWLRSSVFRKKHNALAGDKLYREGHFNDAPTERVAFPEQYLWFAGKELSRRNKGIKELGL